MTVRRPRHPFTLSSVLCAGLIAGGAVACLDAAVADATPAKTGRRKPAPPPFASEASVKVTAFEGTVAEALPAGGYLYLKVAMDSSASTDATEVWVATLAKPVGVGDRVSVRSFAERAPFASKRLDRAFASVLFAVVTSTEAG